MSKDVALNEARSRAGQIRDGILGYLRTLAVIAEAWEKQDWQTLGYADWAAYVDGEFGEARLRLPREHREKAVRELRLLGMSQRAIASALGVAQDTVRAALAEDQVNGTVHLEDSPAEPPARVRGTDGKTYAASRPAREPSPAGPEPAEEVELADGEGDEEAAPPDRMPAVAHDAEAFRSALDEHVPDPDEPLRKWRIAFLKAIGQGRTPLQFADVDVATKADEECLAELRSFATSVQSFLDRVEANRPKPVRSLRVVS